MSSLLAPPEAPIHASVLDRVRVMLTEQTGPGWARSDQELVRDVAGLVALRAQVDGLLLAAVGEVEARGLAARRGCTSTRAWLRSAHRIAPVEAARLVRTATAVRTQLPSVGEAMSTGRVSLAQAEVIVTAIADLPADTPAACRPQAETTMIGYAHDFDPVLLARIGRRLAELIDPDGVQARDEKPILDKEHDAHRDRTLTLSPDTKGASGYLRARLDAAGYATLSAYLNAATAPGLIPESAAQTPTDGETPAEPCADGDHRHLGQRRHDALIEAARQMLSGGSLPSSGGVNRGSSSPCPRLPHPAHRLGPATRRHPAQPHPDPAAVLRRGAGPRDRRPRRESAGCGPHPQAVHRHDPHRVGSPRPRLRVAGM